MPEGQTWHQEIAPEHAPQTWEALHTWWRDDLSQFIRTRGPTRQIHMTLEDALQILRAAGWRSPKEMAALEAQARRLSELRELREGLARGLFGGLDDFALQVVRLLDVVPAEGGPDVASPTP